MTNKTDDSRDDSAGQVSEVGALDGPSEPISDDQGVAGNPEAEDALDGDEAGPNAKPRANKESNRGA